MTEESGSSSAAKQEKLVSHSDWSIWLMIIKFILIEKDIRNLIKKKPRLTQENPALWQKEIKKDQMAIKIVQRIIIKRVNNQIVFNIMDFQDLKDMSTKLKTICSKIGYGVVYSIF